MSEKKSFKSRKARKGEHKHIQSAREWSLVADISLQWE